jgi:hypothetical protein
VAVALFAEYPHRLLHLLRRAIVIAEMNPNLVQLARQREYLTQELSKVRRNAIVASSRQDFRNIAKLTIEAARLNEAILQTQDKELLAL